MEPTSLVIVGIIVIALAVASLKRFDLSHVIVLSNLGIFFIILFSNKFLIFNDLAMQPQDIGNGTAVYTVFTSMFVHYDFAHVIGNMLFLFFLGNPLETRIGKGRFALVYFVSGIVGSMMAALYFIIIEPAPAIFMMGASGAISGVVGTFLVLYPRDEIPMFVGPIFLPRVPIWVSALSWVILGIFLVLLLPSNVSWQAHLGGFIAGMLIGLVLGRRVEVEIRKESAPRDYSKLEALATTPQLKNALENIRDEAHKDVREVWLEYFAEHSQCPKCGGKMKYRKDHLICQCGEVIEIW
ncbi:MAG: rhomboid family intramembrane serine protease [Methanomassiliicoccus sp.]|nr:rhomboid family intramembrane serine protease [Methanomassiliicoccus sp.]